jgi:alpha-L-fucosidase 2
MNNHNALFYHSAASCFEEALPIGNGRMGAAVYGGVEREKLHLNEDTFWSGYPADRNIQGGKRFLEEASARIARGDYLSAQELIEAEFESDMTSYYLPLGDLLLDMCHEGDCAGYIRRLELDTAISSVDYRCGGIRFHREAFISYPDQVLCIHLTASVPGTLSFSLSLDSPLRHHADSSGTDMLVLDVEAPGRIIHEFEDPSPEHCLVYENDVQKQGMRALIMAQVHPVGGAQSLDDSRLHISGADEATILVCMNTSFNGYDRHPVLEGKDTLQLNRMQLHAAAAYAYDELKQRHIADYQQLYKRMSLCLGGDGRADMPTDQRLRLFEQDQNDPGLVELVFQYGRYLMISSSRGDSEPANLQGVWNHITRAPWRCEYTTNINLQMNYWPVHSANLSECARPLVHLMEDCAAAGQKTARAQYDARGFVIHHNCDLWRVTWPVSRNRTDSAAFGFWNMGAAWLCRSLWDCYEYTQDETLLKRKLYPLIKSAALFCTDLLSENADGFLVATPSTSPENRFCAADGRRSGVSAVTTMTMSIIRDLFQICIRCCEILKIDLDFKIELEGKLLRLYPMQIGSKGQILEWDREFIEPEPHHRHISHLYALYPAQDVTPESTPALARACKTSLELRGDEGTGWSLCWKICAWARLRDGSHALKLLNRLLHLVEDTGFNYSDGGGLYPNLLCAHPPFQIDGNFGVVAGICEMLVQSTRDTLELLPALPVQWRTGSVDGLIARGALEIAMEWRDGIVTSLTLRAGADYSGTLLYNGITRQIGLKQGEALKVLPT